MSRFDRYMLSQLMVLFGFFALILVSVFWINQAVRLFDRLVGDGQNALVFLEFSALTLPNVIRLVLPMSIFAAAVYVTNRLSNESELVVMQATGFSPWRLARPVAIYGLIVAALLSVLTHVLVPISLGQMKQREAEISRNLTARLLTEGAFLHPASGVTFYIREISPAGALRDVFLSDRRSAVQAITYTAAEAYLVNDEGRVSLIMVDGLSQAYDARSGRLFTTQFSDFSYDISPLLITARQHVRDVRHIPTLELLRMGSAAVEAETGQPAGRVIEALHNRFAQPLLGIVAALIGFSSLLLGGFSRFGVWRQIVLALLVLVAIKGVEGGVTNAARKAPEMWPLLYLPALLGLIVAVLMLTWVALPRKPRRARPAAAEDAVA